MRLRTKSLMIIGLTWLAFTAITSMKAIRDSSTTYFTLCALLLISLLFFTYAFIIKRIEQLAKHVTKPTHIKGHDEVTSLSNHINTLLSLSHELHEKNETNKNKLTSKLQQATTQLQQETEQREFIENELLNRKEYISHVAKYDNLTSLPNQVVFNEMLNKSINHAKRRKKILAVLLVSINSLKMINDKMGSKNSDELVREVGKRFENVLRSEDVIAKMEGNEFIILLNDIAKPKFASTVAEKLLQACEKPISIGSHEFSIQPHIGICIYPNDGSSLEELLKNIDIALYKAKHSGPHGYQFYTHEMDIEGREHIQLETALRKAISNNEFKLYYQPKLYIKKGSIIGVEGLIRWEHPELGIISPDKFIPAAEETGMIMQIGEWALREACKVNKHWQDEGYEHITVSLNLSPKQFNHPNLPATLSTVLNETGLNPKYLELEITEKTAMDDANTAIGLLNEIKKTGVQIVLDHFGTGYTSISHLKQFPISALKIDQSFIKGIPNNPNDSAITSAMIALAHNLGLEIVAEGVETAEQVQYLASQNCDIVQGYFLSYPLPAETVVNHLKKLRDEVLL